MEIIQRIYKEIINPNKKTIEENGYVQAIRNATLEVYEKKFCNNGPKWFRKINFSKMLSRLVDPTVGEIFFENIDMGKLTKTN